MVRDLARIPDRLFEHATRREQRAEVGLDAAGIARSLRDAIRQAAKVATESSFT